MQLDLFALRLRCKGSLKGAPVTPDELFTPVDNHLRRVDTAQPEVAAVVTLATCIEVRGEWIFPPQAVPIADVLADSHDQLPFGGLASAHLLQQFVGGRAIGTNFRSEQLD